MSRTPTAVFAESLAQHVAERTFGRIRQLAIELGEDRVTLRGSTRSYYHKQLAIQACLEVLGESAAARLEVQIDVRGSEAALAR